MRCSQLRFQSALEALAEGELSAHEFSALREHVGGCAACAAEYERLSRVETQLERRALPQARQALLEQELFSRLGMTAPPQEGASVLRPARWNLRRVALVAMPIAASIVLAVLLAPRVLAPAEEYAARGGAATARYGVRAFCVSAAGAVTAEAGPGETLRCGPGSAVQFSHTSEAAGTLQIVGRADEPLTFFPLEGEPGRVPAGTDVALPHSTPVTAEWLRRPIPVTATFKNAAGEVVGQTELRLEPVP